MKNTNNTDKTHIVGNTLESAGLIKGCLLEISGKPDTGRFAYFLQALIGRYSRGKLDLAVASKYLFKGLVSYTEENPVQIRELCNHLAEAFNEDGLDVIDDLEDHLTSNNKIETRAEDITTSENLFLEVYGDMLPILKRLQKKHELRDA